MWLSPEEKLPPVGGAPEWKQLAVRPTRLGVGLLVMVLLLWLVGLQYQVNLAYAVAFWLLGFAVVAGLLNLRQLLALRLEVAMPHEVFAGGEAVLLVSAKDNVRNRWLWLCNEEDFVSEPKSAAIWREWPLAAGQGEPFQWTVPARHHGYLRIPVLRTASLAPFGICLVQCSWSWTTQMVVYPAPLPHTPDTLTRPDGEEDASRPPLQGGDELAYLQPHQEGMPLHHIAWKSYAKTGQMLDKRFDMPQSAVRSMVISYKDYPSISHKERLAGLLCHRVLEAERSGQPYVLELPHRTIAPQKGQREMALTALALL